MKIMEVIVMTEQEAIIIIGNLDCDTYNIPDSQETKAIAIAALEKQVAKKMMTS